MKDKIELKFAFCEKNKKMYDSMYANLCDCYEEGKA